MFYPTESIVALVFVLTLLIGCLSIWHANRRHFARKERLTRKFLVAFCVFGVLASIPYLQIFLLAFLTIRGLYILWIFVHDELF